MLMQMKEVMYRMRKLLDLDLELTVIPVLKLLPAAQVKVIHGRNKDLHPAVHLVSVVRVIFNFYPTYC